MAQVPLRLPPVKRTVPPSAALLPWKVPLLSSRLLDVKAPLKVLVPLFMATVPAPVNTEPALKVELPGKLRVPVCASSVPLLTKPMPPLMVVLPAPPVLRKVPVLVKLGPAPPL